MQYERGRDQTGLVNDSDTMCGIGHPEFVSDSAVHWVHLNSGIVLSTVSTGEITFGRPPT